MLFFQRCKPFLVISGTLLLVFIALTACQAAPQAQPAPTADRLSTIVAEQQTRVVLLVTATPQATHAEKSAETATPTNAALSLPDQAAAQGIQISLEQVVEIESGYILKGKISKVAGLWLMVLPGEGTQLLDAQGHVIPTKPYFNGTGGTVQDTFADWGLQTIGKNYPGTWRLNIPSLFIELSRKVTFTADLGPAPQIGQSWDLNLPVDFAGYKFFVQKVALFQSENNRPCLNFLFAGGPEIFRVSSLTDPQNRSRHSGGQVSDAHSGTLSLSFCYDQVPTGVRSFDIFMVEVIQPGPWTLRWQPPTLSN